MNYVITSLGVDLNNNAKLKIRAKAIGNYLYSTADASNQVICSIKLSVVHDIFNLLMALSDKRTLEGIFPFPPSFQLVANEQTYNIDAFLTEELLSALSTVIVTTGLGEILKEQDWF